MTVPTVTSDPVPSEWPEDLAEKEADRIAALAEFFDRPGYKPLASPHDDDPFGMFDTPEVA